MEVEAIDKAGNFIGWLFVDNTNLSVALVEVNSQTQNVNSPYCCFVLTWWSRGYRTCSQGLSGAGRGETLETRSLFVKSRASCW